MMLTGPPAPLRWQQRDVTQGGHFLPGDNYATIKTSNYI